MVYKVSKAGVRSGNTLRGLHTSARKRYSRQACMVGRSNMRCRETESFLESVAEDSMLKSCLGSTDVILSLNKKARWRLPATFNHMIKSGSLDKGKTTVSLLERHKLKRRANCVSFICNYGRLRKVTPNQKRYFSLNMDTFDVEESNRQRRRRKAEVLKSLKPEESTITKDKKNRPVKTIEVFTVSGVGNPNSLAGSKPEYRLEVFYPCPQSCSLVYNPKYTKIHDIVDEETKRDIKLTKSKKGKKTRKPFTYHDVHRFEEEEHNIRTDVMFDNEEDTSDTNSLSEENSFDNEIYAAGEDCMLNSSCSGEDESTDEVGEAASQRSNFTENIWVSLITQAEIALACVGEKQSRKSRQHSMLYQSKETRAEQIKSKSHIVHIDPPPKEIPIPVVTKKLTRRQRAARKSKAQTQEETTIAIKMQPSESIKQEFARLILSSTETSPETLKATYGAKYFEADSQPRRFVINVSEDVENLLSSCKHCEPDVAYCSFLVFIHDGIYDDGLDCFRLTFNSNICPETRFLRNFPFEQLTIAEIVNKVASILLNLQADNLLPIQACSEKRNNPQFRFMSSLFGLNLTTLRTCNEIRRMAEKEEEHEHCSFSSGLYNITGMSDIDIFCDICYENINPSHAEAVSGTRLNKCSHVFCNDCWKSHITTRLKSGSWKITCPGYGCQEEVGPITLLSLVHVSEVTKLFQRQCEQQAESLTDTRWCPYPECGRMVKVNSHRLVSGDSFDVTCVCGHEFCFRCQSTPHWPASCQQFSQYIQNLHRIPTTNNSSIDTSEVSISTPTSGHIDDIEVEGCLCPKCNKFIDKNGGCQHMTCHCGHQFCWICLKDWMDHGTCQESEDRRLKFTQKVKVRHILIPPASSTLDVSEMSKKPKRDTSRHGVTMQQKAVEQRAEARKCKFLFPARKMAKKLAHICQRDLRLKLEILSICGIDALKLDESELFQCAFVSPVTKFLSSFSEIKRTLHHVAEFTFVLLQDVPDSLDKRRILKMANDLNAYCTFISSIMEQADKQDVRLAVRRLKDIQVWAKNLLTRLLSSVDIMNASRA